MDGGGRASLRPAPDELDSSSGELDRNLAGELETLRELVTRLSDHPDVTGIVLGGSHATGQQTAWSDLDLLLVFRGPDLLFTHVTTTIDETLTEIVCGTRDDLDRVMRGDAPSHWDAATFVRFLGGHVLFDRDDSLKTATAWALLQPALGPSEDPYGRWRHSHYNVRQTRRYLASGDESARAAVVARMLYSLHDILRDYFTMRDMAWPGDKDALAYWHVHVPALRRAWLAAVAETNIERKVNAWEAMFPLVYDRFGGSAPPELDLIQPANDTTIEQAYAFWKTLTD